MTIKEPTLVINKERVIRNIEKMSNKARKNNVYFRPHFKTHQSLEIGRWFRDFGVDRITVSSVKMAKYFASDDWDDITIAFPVNILEIDDINELASKIKLNILIVDSEVIPFLLKNIKYRIGLFLKVDTGAHRTGISPENINEIEEIINKLSKSDLIEFKGFLAHSGHTYQSKTEDEVRAIYNNAADVLNSLKIKTCKDALISVGDTPACSILDNLNGADEIRPGNFTFYDIMQLNIGSCSEEDIAVALACPIVAKHNDRNEIIIYGGAVHLSKDFILDKEGNKTFGALVEFDERGWGKIVQGAYLKGMSQEHGIIKVDNPSNRILSKKIGDILGVLPIHSCLTADLMNHYITLDGKTITMMSK